MVAQPGGAVSGRALTTQPVVEIRDGTGNRSVGSTAQVTVTVASGNATLQGTTTVSAVGGVASFTDLRLDGSGPVTLGFSSTGLTGVTSGAVTVTQQAASLRVVTQPGGAAVSTAFTVQPVIDILDEAGLRVTTGAGATLSVTATVASGAGTLSGTTAVTAAAGVATFGNLALSAAGAHTLRFTLASPAVTVESASFEVVASPPTALGMVAQPAGAVSGRALTTQPVVEIRDGTGNRSVGSTAQVTVTVASGNATLQGTTTVSAVGGVASFTDLRLDGSGPVTLGFSSTGLTGVTSVAVTVAQEAASLGVVTQPGGAAVSTAFTVQPVIEILDEAGLRVTTGAGATLSVTATVASGAGTLSGTTAVTAAAGVATFGNLALSAAGAHTLRFALASPAVTVESASFEVTEPAVPTTLELTLPQASVSGNAQQTATAIVRDQSGAVMDIPVTWSVQHPLVARVSPSGEVQALGAGSTNVIASVAGLTEQAPLTVSFGASAFNIEYEFVGTVATDIQQMFVNAATRWSQAIVGNLPAISASNLNVQPCSGVTGQTFTGVIDDLLIYVRVEDFGDDFPNTLGSAGPCYERIGGAPVIGRVRLNSRILGNYSEAVQYAVILHEIGHVLGIGLSSGDNPLWPVQDPSPESSQPACEAFDPIFAGPAAVWTFPLVVPGYTGRSVPVENCHGVGTRNSHWRESVLNRELMTGFINLSGNFLSPLTLASLIDMGLGYVVDISQHDAQPWTAPGVPPGDDVLVDLHAHPLPMPAPIVIDDQGRQVPRPPGED
jgi:uncharacterized protein YqgV (UPF0045/DUF77 family)